jgi:hypothetical protein
MAQRREELHGVAAWAHRGASMPQIASGVARFTRPNLPQGKRKAESKAKQHGCDHEQSLTWALVADRLDRRRQSPKHPSSSPGSTTSTQVLPRGTINREPCGGEQGRKCVHSRRGLAVVAQPSVGPIKDVRLNSF